MPGTIDTVDLFAGLFKGRVDAWRGTTGAMHKEQVTKEHYKKHLEGAQSLAIFPLLDDGTCWWAALDLDIKDWAKAVALHDELLKHNCAAYISASKSKGYHIWVFADPKDAFVAKDIRRLFYNIVKQLGIKEAEIFPKQDVLDSTVPIGNCLNLPGFASLSKDPKNPPVRQFLDKDQKPIPLQQLVTTALHTTRKTVADALAKFGSVIPTIVPSKTKLRVKGKIPPCIAEIQRGMTAGSRDIAAFALARHYLDNYTESEVLGLLMAWDKLNTPPLGQRELETKIKSAAKGYGFGCKSIKGEAMLAQFCPGEQHCQWIQKVIADKKRAGLIIEKTFHESPTHIYEEIYHDSSALYIAYDKKSGGVTYIPQIDAGEVTIVPVISAEILEGVVTLPEGVDEYGDTVTLVEEIIHTIHKYVDISRNDEEFAAWYIMMSWVYDRLDTLSYLRFSGDTGSGKSRCLDVIGKLCYKPIMMAGAVTPAPIYRLIERFRGTIILEEADFRDSTEKGEVVTILNAGFERGRPIIRCAADDPSTLQVLPCYGPKVFATRFRFSDNALEARCMIMKMEETNRDDIPPILGRIFRDAVAELRKKLLMWRLRNLNQIDPSTIDLINLENGNRLEPRLKQIGLPYAVPFQNMPDVMEKFREFMKRKQDELIEERSDSMEGLCVNALFKLSLEHGKGNVSAKMISQEISGTARADQAEDKQNQKGRAIAVGRYLNELNIKTTNKRIAEQPRARYILWNDELMRKLLRRYVIDISDFTKLFEANQDELNI